MGTDEVIEVKRIKIRVTRVLHETVIVEVPQDTWQEVAAAAARVPEDQRQLDYTEFYTDRVWVEVPTDDDNKPVLPDTPNGSGPEVEVMKSGPGTEWLRGKHAHQ